MLQAANLEFAKRLDRACDRAGLGGYGKGARLRRALREQFDDDVSAETISRYFKGEMQPRRPRLRYLAEILGTSPAALSPDEIDDVKGGDGLQVDGALLSAIKVVADQRGVGVSEVVADLLRRGLAEIREPQTERNGVPLLPAQVSGASITLKVVNALRDEAP